MHSTSDFNLFNETFIDSLSKTNEFYSPNYTIKIFLTILSRIGFILLQIDNAKSKEINFHSILFKNIRDICFTTIIYLTIGFIVIFDADIIKFIYGDYYHLKNILIKKEKFVIGWQVVIMSSAVCTISMNEDIRFVIHFLINLFLTGLVQPFFIRWSWISDGWIAKGKLNNLNVHYYDHGGSGIVHVVGGLSGTIVYLLLSRKNHIFQRKNINQINLSPLFTNYTYLGLILIFFGLMNFSISITDNYISNTINTIINNLLAACSCFLSFTCIHLIFKKSIDHWTTLRSIQCLIVGLIIISSGSNKYSHLMSIGLGCLGGIIFYFITKSLFYNDLENHWNIIEIHLIYGFISNILVPFCITENNATIQSILLNFSWQLISLIALIGLVVISLTPLILILNTFGLFKQRSKIFKIHESTNNLERIQEFLDKNLTYNEYEDSIINNTNLISIKFIGENFDHSQNELSRINDKNDDEFIHENYLNKIIDVKNEEESFDPSKSSGRRIHKLRHIYTLSGYNLTMSKDRFGDGDRIDIVNNKKYFSETNLENFSNNSNHMKEISNKLNLNCSIDIKENNNDDEINETIKNQYQLRRTQKFMNLREELDKQYNTIKLNEDNK